MSIFGCKHKYGLIQADKFQYCTKCGIAHKLNEHEHKWDIIDTVITQDKMTDSILSKTYTLQCTVCGELKKEVIIFTSGY
jgi:hypothetical protein